jgi:hypothetical protein
LILQQTAVIINGEIKVLFVKNKDMAKKGVDVNEGNIL